MDACATDSKELNNIQTATCTRHPRTYTHIHVQKTPELTQGSCDISNVWERTTYLARRQYTSRHVYRLSLISFLCRSLQPWPSTALFQPSAALFQMSGARLFITYSKATFYAHKSYLGMPLRKQYSHKLVEPYYRKADVYINVIHCRGLSIKWVT